MVGEFSVGSVSYATALGVNSALESNVRAAVRPWQLL
jgi:hypothetical protein